MAGLTFTDGQANIATAQALQHGTGEGPYAVSGGALCWDPRFDAPELAEYTPRGYAVGSMASATEMYNVTMRLRDSCNRLANLFARLVGPSWQFGQAVPAQAQQVLALRVNAEIQFGTCLRVLSRLYTASGLLSSARSRQAAQRDVDFQHVHILDIADPASRGVPRVQSVGGRAGWEAMGIDWIARWLAAYPTYVTMPAAEQNALARDLSAWRARLRGQAGVSIGPWSAGQAMGLVPVWAVVVVVIVAIGAATMLGDKTIGGTMAFMGVSPAFLDTMVEQYEGLMEECRAGDDRACALARELATQIAGYAPVTNIVKVAAVVGLAYLAWRAYRKMPKGSLGRSFLF